MLPRTHWFIIATCEHSTPSRCVLDWLRNTICSGPPSTHPSDPVRVGHQMLHESHRLRFHRGVYWCTTCGQIAQHAAGKKSRAIGLVNECPGHLTRAGRDVLARTEKRLSPKASADWPLMRDTVSVDTVSTPMALGRGVGCMATVGKGAQGPLVCCLQSLLCVMLQGQHTGMHKKESKWTGW